MSAIVLSIAGFDGSAGAGILADIKTFQRCGVYGMGVLSAITLQNEDKLTAVNWLKAQEIIEQIAILAERYQIKCCKIGIVENLSTLESILDYLAKLTPKPFVIWDPIIKSSSGYEFHSNLKVDHSIFGKLDLVTPNVPEAELLMNAPATQVAAEISKDCAVILKGGHSDNINTSDDCLYVRGECYLIKGKRLAYSKHGSGCVFSASLAAHYALNGDLLKACFFAKEVTLDYLQSSGGLLGVV